MINYRFGQKRAKILKVERPLNIVLLLLLVHFPLGSAMGSAAATASIADLTPSCNTSYYTAQQPTDAECKSLYWVKINLDGAFLFYCIFYKKLIIIWQ